MKISCNKLKNYIKDSNQIDWLAIWDKFSIRTAEVEEVVEIGKDIRDVVAVEITKCEKHETKDNYHVLEVTDGIKSYSILCGAPNVKLGMIAPLVKVKGMVKGFVIEEKKIAGVLSEGMLCAGDELGLNDDHDGIIELPNDTILGIDIKEIYPIEDIVIEIDNKSLTNRPDLWGHYGIAREIAAITEKELLPLELENIVNDKNDLNIIVKDKENCLRYCGITLDNIKTNKTPLEMQIFLKYVGIRPISLMVDLTNYVMLELGQPMHAFDKNMINGVTVDSTLEEVKFNTLDGIERVLPIKSLVIENENEIVAVAGIMGGENSSITETTKSIFLESATFDSANIRKTSSSLGLRTDASLRYEKTLDPELCEESVKRFIYLLKTIDNDVTISSNITDIYSKKYPSVTVNLTKSKLRKYMGIEVPDEKVKSILERLNFKVEVNEESYSVKVPSNRATKDVSMDADIIEEISRMYGYENIEETPINVDSTFTIYEEINEEEYNVKSFLTRKYAASEVHSYLWYDSQFLKDCNIEKENVTVINKTDNNILRDDLTLSLLPFVKNNFKNLDLVKIYEIGTIVNNDENKRALSIIVASSSSKAEETYKYTKQIVVELFENIKHRKVSFRETTSKEYYENGYSLSILIDGEEYGTINVTNSKINYNLGKKKFVSSVEIDFDKFLTLNKKEIIHEEKSKYQEVTLDYTILVDSSKKYSYLEEILNAYNNDFVNSYKLLDIYNNENINKYSIRFNVSSLERTLDNKDLQNIKSTFMKHIKENNLEIIE